MARSVTAARVLPEDAGAHAARRLQGPPASWLPSSARRSGGSWTLTVRAGRMVRVVRARIGPCVLAGDDAWRPLTWEPLQVKGHARDTSLPAFAGTIAVRTAGAGAVDGSWAGGADGRGAGNGSGGLPGGDPAGHPASSPLLVVSGRYVPPGGIAGRGLDAVLLHHVARHTLAALASDLEVGLLADEPDEVLEAGPSSPTRASGSRVRAPAATARLEVPHVHR